jgi:hypothetical protein
MARVVRRDERAGSFFSARSVLRTAASGAVAVMITSALRPMTSEIRELQPAVRDIGAKVASGTTPSK